MGAGCRLGDWARAWAWRQCKCACCQPPLPAWHSPEEGPPGQSRRRGTQDVAGRPPQPGSLVRHGLHHRGGPSRLLATGLPRHGASSLQPGFHAQFWQKVGLLVTISPESSSCCACHNAAVHTASYLSSLTLHAFTAFIHRMARADITLKVLALELLMAAPNSGNMLHHTDVMQASCQVLPVNGVRS